MAIDKRYMSMTSEVRNAKYPFNWIIFAYKYGMGFSDTTERYIQLNRKFESEDYNDVVRKFDSVIEFFKENSDVSKNIERDINIFLDVFKHKMTYTDASKKYGIGTERIRQIILKMTRYLKSPKYWLMMMYDNGVEKYEAQQSEYNLNKMIISELSTRSYNILNRLVCSKHITDLSKLSFADIVFSRNCGIHSAEEIMSVLKKYNVSLRKQSNTDRHYIEPNSAIAKKYADIITTYFGSIDNI